MSNDWATPAQPSKSATRWWKRRYRGAPVWVWATGGALALGAVGNALETDPAREVVVSSEEVSLETAASVSTTEAAASPTTTAPPPTTTVPSTTTSTTTTTSTSTTTTSTTTTTTTSPPTTPPPPPPTEPPPPPETAVQPFIPATPDCDPNYSGCVPIDFDVDCAGGSGNGPSYVRGPVQVIGSDIYGLDGDNDGIGCE